MLTSLTTRFVGRLQARDPEAWFELWEIFGPVLQSQLRRWGRGRIGPETVQDLSQETLAALSNAIDRHDPSKGARFSTWLLAIAKHTLGGEMDRRMALKRGAGKPNASLDEAWMQRDGKLTPDREYEGMVFRAKVEAAIRRVERDADFLDFSIYRMRVFDSHAGKEVAESLGISEATVSRRLAKVRQMLQSQIREVVETFSFTREEYEEAARNGLVLNPNKSDDALFDEALAEVYHQQAELRRTLSTRGGPSG
ncbi:MAG: sigma-70 family RNA polymerase sigma factor [Planctomycetota bacterium]|nr:MAG: sigma-70 family RNA polymerase sigma factor [Planctomycetota bacterium]